MPQGDGSAGPAFTRRAEGGERNLIVLDACDVLDNAFAVRRPGIDAEGEVISRRGHVRLFYPIRLGLDSKKGPGFLRGRGLSWQSETLEVSGLTISPNPERRILVPRLA